MFNERLWVMLHSRRLTNLSSLKPAIFFLLPLKLPFITLGLRVNIWQGRIQGKGSGGPGPPT